MYFIFFSDGGFLSHNAAKDTYPQPIPTKHVIFPASNGSATKDVPNHTENDLPTYNDYMVSTKNKLRVNSPVLGRP